MIGEKPPNLVEAEEDNRKRSSRREVWDFFDCVLVVVDPTSRPHFYVGAAMSPADRPCFFVGAVVGLAISLGRADGLVIGKAVLTGADVAVSFYGLSLW